MSEQTGGRFDTFQALEPDKRQRIIDAALGEFAEKGYDRASTNTIAANAKIGKGMLFYYFGSKEDLFDFLCEYAIEFIRREFLDEFDANTGDFIERQRRLATAKRRAMEKKPLLFALFVSFYGPKNSEYAAKYSDTLSAYRAEFAKKLYDNIDLSLFCANIDPMNAIQYITWLLDGYTAEIERKLAAGSLDTGDVDEWARFDTFIGDLNKLFYNREE